MIAAGVDRGSALARLEQLRAEVRASGNEELEDAIMDIMDRVVGWCSPQNRMYPEK
jgi:hypothetical protein